MKKPLIGLTPSLNTDSDELQMRLTYIKALTAAGAIALVLPPISPRDDLKQLAHVLDGFLFTGGPDLHPFVYKEEAHAHCGSVSTERDQMELMLFSLAMEVKKPILGICRGIQLINTAMGGTLWQDIPSQVKRDFPLAHSQPFSYSLPSHTVAIRHGSLLAEISEAETLSVNSMHHQAVKNVAPGLAATAFSCDHLVEALEMPDYPFLIGVQWHPEYLWEKDESAAKLFAAFAKAAGAEGKG